MSRQTLNIHNDFTGLSLVGFDATEIDLLSAVCHEMQNQGTTKMTIGFAKLRELSQYKGHDNDRLFEDLRSMDNKLATLNFKRSTDDTYMRFTLFPTFSLSRTEQEVTVAVNNSFVYLLNELGSQYTAIELMESASLKSRYSKQIYKRLKQFRDTGVWIVSVTDFRDYLDVPKTYRMTQIEERVIKVALKELSPYFDNLAVQKEVRHNAHHRGRPKYDTLVWRFKPQKNMSESKKSTAQQKPDSNQVHRRRLRNRRRPRPVQKQKIRQQNQLQTASSETAKARMTCPKCGEKAVIELTAKDGHQFWKCENCQTTFSTIAEVKGIPETPSRTAKIDDTATESDDRCVLTPQEMVAIAKRLNRSGESTNTADPDAASEQQEKPSKPENQYLVLEATKLKKLVNNSKSGEIGIKKLCNQLDGIVERENVMADITPIAEVAGYTAIVTEYYASDDLKPKKIRFDKR